jgi:hypothetical protein
MNTTTQGAKAAPTLPCANDKPEPLPESLLRRIPSSAIASGQPEVIGHTHAGAPIWLMRQGDIVLDIPIPWRDAAGNEVFA